MSTLMLIDLDNVREKLSQREADLPVLAGPHTLVLAGNTKTLQEFTTGRLAAAAAHFAQAAGIREWGSIELVPVRSIPEAADVALVRLLGEGPGEPANFTEVRLDTKDGGLYAAFADRLGRPVARGVWHTRWRRLGTAGAGVHPPTGFVPSAFSQPVADPPSAAWAAGRRSALPAGAPGMLARAIERVPHHLTEVGLTTTSVRGAGRAWDLVCGRSPVLAADCHDGLVLSGPGRAPTVAMATAPSPAGAGTLWVEEGRQRAIASTRLPPSMVPAVPPLLNAPGTAPRVDDASVLLKPHQGPQVMVRFQTLGRSMVSEVVFDPARGPDAWWISMARASAKPRLHGIVTFPREFEIAARPAAGTGDLILVAGPEGGVVNLARGYGCGLIVRAVLRNGQPVALWTDCGLPAGEYVVERIHPAVPDVGSLPLVVVVQH
jgi:hypothetical protein